MYLSPKGKTMRAAPTHHSQDGGKLVVPNDFCVHKELFHGLNPTMCLLICRFTSAVSSRDVVLLGCCSPLNTQTSLGIALQQLEAAWQVYIAAQCWDRCSFTCHNSSSTSGKAPFAMARHIRRTLHSSGAVSGDIDPLSLCSRRRVAHYCRRS